MNWYWVSRYSAQKLPIKPIKAKSVVKKRLWLYINIIDQTIIGRDEMKDIVLSVHNWNYSPFWGGSRLLVHSGITFHILDVGGRHA